jgi:PAS domain S-box-containing protein
MVRISENGRRTSAALLAEIADVPYFRVDARRTVVEMSPAMERLTGFTAEESVGRSCLNLHRCEECLGGCGVFDRHTVLDKDLELYRADGSTVRVRKSGRVLLDEEGRITGAIEVLWPVAGAEARTAETVRPLAGESPVDVAPGCELTPAAAAARDEITSIREALQITRYNRTEAARQLGMSRTTLWRKMREYGL